MLRISGKFSSIKKFHSNRKSSLSKHHRNYCRQDLSIDSLKLMDKVGGKRRHMYNPKIPSSRYLITKRRTVTLKRRNPADTTLTM